MPPGWVRSSDLLGHLVLEGDLQAAVDVRHVLQVALDQVGVELRGLEDVRVRLEVDGGAVAAEGADLFQLAGRLAALEGLLPLEAVAADGGDELLRQGVDDRRADAVQAAGVDVAVAVAELGAGVQRGQDQLQAGLLVLGMDVDRDAAAVVADGDGVAGLVQGDGDGVGVAVEVLVDGVIDDLPDEVVQALAVDAADVHRRPFADGLQAFEDLEDVLGGVFLRGGKRTHAISLRFNGSGKDVIDGDANHGCLSFAAKPRLLQLHVPGRRWPPSSLPGFRTLQLYRCRDFRGACRAQ